MDPQPITALTTIGLMAFGAWLMFRRGLGRARGATPPEVPSRFDHAVTMTLAAAVAFQFFAGRVPIGSLSTSTAIIGAGAVVILVAIVPATRLLISIAALGIFLIENYAAMGLRGIAFLGFVLLLSAAAHLVLKK